MTKFGGDANRTRNEPHAAKTALNSSLADDSKMDVNAYAQH